MLSLKRYFQLPFRHHILRKHLKRPPGVVVDIGCGNSAPSTKSFLAPARYCGIDIRPEATVRADVRRAIDEYLEVDLTQAKLPPGLRRRADVVIMAHVLEHLENGPSVLAEACDLLAPGGLIYVEYPAFRSTKLPSMNGTLNFWDDDTHVRLYQMIEILNVFNSKRLHIVQFGTRRYLRRVLLTPFLLPYLLYKKASPAVALWDLLGFAEYAIARLPNESLN